MLVLMVATWFLIYALLFGFERYQITNNNWPKPIQTMSTTAILGTLIHAAIVISCGLYVLLDYTSALNPLTFSQHLLIAFSLSWFLIDSLWIMVDRNWRKDMILHHIICIMGLSVALQSQKYGWIIVATICIGEMGPCVYLDMMAKRFGWHTPRFEWWNDTAYLISFTLTRFGLYSGLCVMSFIEPLPNWLRAPGLALLAMSYYWNILLIKKYIRRWLRSSSADKADLLQQPEREVAMSEKAQVSVCLEQQEAQKFDLSIVIPVYNDTLKLENVLNSFYASFKESELRVEVILVDNNSPKAGEIYEIVQRQQGKMPLVLIHQPPLVHPFSLCSARNRGVLNARGEYIFFTDSDCMINEAFLSAFRSILKGQASGVRIFTGERVFVKIPEVALPSDSLLAAISNLERTPSASNYGKEKDRRFPWLEALPSQAHPWNFVHGCFMLLKKADYLAVGGSDTAYDGNWGYEEIDLVYRMVTHLNATVHYLPEAKVYHQELPSDLLKIHQNDARTNKSTNPNYQRICERIPGFDEFKKQQWNHLNVKVS